MPIRLSGMASGLDTDTIVKELVSAYSTRKDSIVKKQTKLSWTQDAWKSMNTKVYNFYSKSLSNMRLSGSYNKKSTSISNNSVAKVSASNNAVNGTQTLKVKSLATSGYLTGGVIEGADGSKVSGSTKLSEVKGLDSLAGLGSIEVNVDGKTKQIELSGDMTLSQLAVKFKDAGVSANFDEKNQRFFVSSKTSGSAGDFSITASTSDAIDALKGLGLYAVTDKELLQYKDNANLDVASKVAEEYDKQKKAYLDKDATKTDLEKQVTQLAKDKDALTNKADVLAKKVEYLRFEYDGEGADVTFKADQETPSERATRLKTDVERYQSELDALNEKENLSDEESARKIELENTIKAANEAITVLENDVYVAADFKKAFENADSESTKASEQLTATQDKLARYEKALSSDAELDAYIAEENDKIDEANEKLMQDLTDYYTNLKNTAADIIANNSTATNMATRIIGQDAEIELNGATFTNNTNSFEINGLTIQATSVTGDEAVTISTDTDIDGVYNMIKDFFSDYNELMKSMDEAYNATSAGKYEPLTDDEKEAMTDSQIEQWEKKIKDSLLRKDATLGAISSSMKTLMSKSYSVNGKNYSLSSFGINTLGYFASGSNEKGLYHIDGDEDDTNTSGNTDKLKAAIANDPDAVITFFSKLTTEVYTDLTKKMASSSLSSAYTVYNDKQMKTQYSNYTSSIAEWEDKIQDYEDRYYKQFSAMEKALASLNSQQSQLSGLFG